MRLLLLAASLATPAWADWGLLAAIEIEEVQIEDRWEARKTYPEALLAATEGFEITGHVVPVVPDAELRLFLLVPDPEQCPFCGDAGYGPSLEVEMRDALDAVEGEEVTLAGRLEIVADAETWQAVRLTDAVRAAPSGS
jgi:hypothetical protein